MIPRTLVATALAGALTVAWDKAEAQLSSQPSIMFCTSPEILAKGLQQHNEIPVWTGTNNNGAIHHLFKDKAGTSYSFIVHIPNGPSCIVASGTENNLLQESKEVVPELGDAPKEIQPNYKGPVYKL